MFILGESGSQNTNEEHTGPVVEQKSGKVISGIMICNVKSVILISSMTNLRLRLFLVFYHNIISFKYLCKGISHKLCALQ